MGNPEVDSESPAKSGERLCAHVIDTKNQGTVYNPTLAVGENRGKDCLPGFPHPLEGRRPRHPGLETSQGGVREAEIRQGHIYL
jgi:hypothetical protein